MDDDPCALKPVVAGGLAEVGLGGDFTPIVDGENAGLVLGPQGLWMFVLNARTCDMNVGAGDRDGVVVVSAVDEARAPISVDFGCRVREFVEHPGGGCPSGSSYSYLSTPYQMPMRPEATSRLEGARVTIQIEVRDVDGRRATGTHTVVAHFPQSSP